MKKIIVLLMSGVCGLLAAGTVLTVDLGEVYENYYKSKIAQDNFNNMVSNAQKEIQKMVEEGQTMFKKLQEDQEKLNNPALSESARKKLTEEVEKQVEALRKKEFEVNQFKQNTDFTLAQRREGIVKQHLDEIRKQIELVAKEKKVELVLNNETLLYSLPSSNITKEVIKRVNANQPKKK